LFWGRQDVVYSGHSLDNRQITGIIQIHKLLYPSRNNYSHHDHTYKAIADVNPTSKTNNSRQSIAIAIIQYM